MNKVIADRMKLFGITCYDENGSKIDDIINSATKIKFPHALHLNLDKCRGIGLVLSRCKMLQELCLNGNRGCLGEEMLVALFLAEGPYNFPLKSLDLGNNQFGTRELTTILPFLKSWEALNSLSVEGNCINNRGAQLLAEVLDTVRIRRLSLNRNQISKEGLSCILSSQNARYLTSLMISNNGDIGSAEIDQIARFLRHGSSSLELLEVGNYRQYFLIRWIETIYRSIRNNMTLSKLRIFAGSLHDPMDKEASRKAISCRLDHAAAALVCDSSSIDAFCRSNHTFSGVELTEARLSVRYAPSPVVRLAFKINERGDISTERKIRCKLHSIYFHGDFDIVPFYAMKLVWIPQVLEFFAGFEQHRDSAEETKGGSLTHAGSLSDLYYFIRRWNFPELFTFALPTRAS